MRRFAAMAAASLVSNVCVIPSLLFTGTDANPTAPLRCSMMNHFVIVSAHRLLGGREHLLLIGKALLGDGELVAQLVVNDCGLPSGGRVSVALDAQSFERGIGGESVCRHEMSPVAARLASKSAAAMRLEGRVPFDRAGFGTIM
jgi:hypothetical protein